MTSILREFFKWESAGGILLVIAACVAMIVANSDLSSLYVSSLHYYLLGMSVTHWINDGLMAVFFLLIGLEVKRELLEGALRSKETAIFPAIAALGGMLAPAAVYSAINASDSVAINGWAISAATDIAFALGIMALLGKRVPISLKVFLLALAIIDDLGVIIIIAVFYSADLSVLALGISAVAIVLLVGMNLKNVTCTWAYLLVGLILWAAVLKSGVHATLAGVIVGFAIPLKGKSEANSPLKQLEHGLHPYVAFIILPLFAFVNAGVSLSGVQLTTLTHQVPLGVALGLFIGKPLGVFSFSWLSVRLGLAKLPDGINFLHIFAVSVLCGIGFTMSIFISSLAFGETASDYDNFARLGILTGSTLAAFTGYFLLNAILPKKPAEDA